MLLIETVVQSTVNTAPFDTDTDELTLVAAAQSGDRRAFEALFDRVLPKVRTIAAFGMGAQLRSRLEIDDAVQEIFTEALRLLPQFDPRREGSFFGWLREVARHKLLALADRELGREKRDPRRQARLPDSTTAFSLMPPATVTSPTGAILRSEQLDLLHRALAKLNDEHRKVILMRCIEGRSTAETAAALGRNENAASVLLFRALAKLRECYKNEEGQ